MKKKTLSLAVASVLTVSLIGGATYAWFSDKEYGLDDGASGAISEDQTIKAGFVDITFDEGLGVDNVFTNGLAPGTFSKGFEIENKTNLPVVAQINIGNVLTAAEKGEVDLYTLHYDGTDAGTSTTTAGVNFFWEDPNEVGKYYVDHAGLNAIIPAFAPYTIDAAGAWNTFYEKNATDLPEDFTLALKGLTGSKNAYVVGNSIYVSLAVGEKYTAKVEFELVDASGVSLGNFASMTNRFQYAMYSLVQDQSASTDPAAAFIFAKATQPSWAAVTAELGGVTAASIAKEYDATTGLLVDDTQQLDAYISIP